MSNLYTSPSQFSQAIQDPRKTVYLYQNQAFQNALSTSPEKPTDWQPLGQLPPLYPEYLGDPKFKHTHQLRFAYVTGEMANGIATPNMVIAAAKNGMLGFLGSAGLPLSATEQHLITLNQALPKQAWGANLIHTPQHPELEIATVDLFLKHHVKRASASAFMTLTPALVKYAYHGLTQDSQGHILRKQHLFGKVSRVEVAEKLMLPAPEKLLQQLIIEGHLTEHETQLGRLIPVCDDITAEADSGGHTDNRPLHVLLPSLLQLRQSLSLDNPCCKNIRIGAAGGLGTPHAVAGAFAMGAAYVLTASINQPCIESGLSDAGKQALHEATETDVMMAAAGDMFELGVKVQVLKKRSLFAVRANQLYDLYKRYDGIQHLPQDSVDKLNTWFQQPIESVWQETQPYLQQHNPQDLVRAEQDEKHKMALIFRWYLGLSSRWAITGEQHRSADYQIWTGPALGAFNRWVKGQYLEDLNERTVGQIGLNLMEGAAVITRANQLKNAGFELSAEGFEFPPRPIHLS